MCFLNFFISCIFLLFFLISYKAHAYTIGISGNSYLEDININFNNLTYSLSREGTKKVDFYFKYNSYEIFSTYKKHTYENLEFSEYNFFLLKNYNLFSLEVKYGQGFNRIYISSENNSLVAYMPSSFLYVEYKNSSLKPYIYIKGFPKINLSKTSSGYNLGSEIGVLANLYKTYLGKINLKIFFGINEINYKSSVKCLDKNTAYIGFSLGIQIQN